MNASNEYTVLLFAAAITITLHMKRKVPMTRKVEGPRRKSKNTFLQASDDVFLEDEDPKTGADRKRSKDLCSLLCQHWSTLQDRR